MTKHSESDSHPAKIYAKFAFTFPLQFQNTFANFAFMLVAKSTLCALGLLRMHILTGQTFLLCCCSFPQGPSSSSPSFLFASPFYCGETLLIADTPNVDNRTDCDIYAYQLLIKYICLIRITTSSCENSSMKFLESTTTEYLQIQINNEILIRSSRIFHYRIKVK